MDREEQPFLSKIQGNAIWDGVKWSVKKGWALMTPFLYAFYEKLRHAQIDWYLFIMLSGVAFLHVLVLIILYSQAKISPRNPEAPSAGGKYKPAWQRLQWCNAERERLGKEIERLKAASPKLPDMLFSALQIEILHLVADLGKLMKDAGPAPTLKTKIPGPMPKSANVQLWAEMRQIEADEYTKAYTEWARKFIYSYRQQFADRVKKVRDSIGASTGMVVVSLDPYTTDITPGGEFKNLIGILLGFFAEIEKEK